LATQGRLFNFFAPDPEFRLEPGAVVLTFGALEQVGDRFGPFLEFLRANRPLRCVHVEVLEEMYDDSLLLDALALRYHRSRGYLSGFLPALQQRAARGELVLERVFRQHFGNRFNDTFSYLIWQPAAS
jgi:hypothetical protein